jgi:hypothetical protein
MKTKTDAGRYPKEMIQEASACGPVMVHALAIDMDLLLDMGRTPHPVPSAGTVLQLEVHEMGFWGVSSLPMGQ